ncbi:MAG: PTS transporter subunit IIC [Lachnospiraceae bacterium]
MSKVKKVLYYIFIDGLSGMAIGLFGTLLIGTIIQQIGGVVPGTMGELIVLIGKIGTILTGVGIGMGVAIKLKASQLVCVCACVSGFIGAFASKILGGSMVVDGTIALSGPGEPLGAFLATILCIYVGSKISGKTKIDILLTPFACIFSGAMVGLLVGPPISRFLIAFGEVINWGTMQAPFLMGVIVSVLMGMALTLPISSAALSVILGLSGLAAGAATVGCCANMVGFAVASFRENKINGLFAQGIGTSMLQVSNIVKKPVIWVPAILTSAILGPLSTMVFKMTNNATGAGMGTCGLVGPINTVTVMVEEGGSMSSILLKIVVLYIILPALLSFVISEFMRKKQWIKEGDMKLDI